MNRIISVIEAIPLSYGNETDSQNTEDHQKKDPSSKKPMSSFHLFLRDYKSTLEDADKIPYHELLKRASTSWKSLANATKETYRSKAEHALHIYNEKTLLSSMHAFFSEMAPIADSMDLGDENDPIQNSESSLVLLADKGDDDAFESSIEPDELFSPQSTNNSESKVDKLKVISNGSLVSNQQIITPEMTPQQVSKPKKPREKKTPIKATTIGSENTLKITSTNDKSESRPESDVKIDSKQNMSAESIKQPITPNSNISKSEVNEKASKNDLNTNISTTPKSTQKEKTSNAEDISNTKQTPVNLSEKKKKKKELPATEAIPEVYNSPTPSPSILETVPDALSSKQRKKSKDSASLSKDETPKKKKKPSLTSSVTIAQ